MSLQSHTQNPLQVGAEIQSRFFASQGCTQSPFQAATTAPPPPAPATSADSLQVDLLPVLAAAQETAAAAAVVGGCHGLSSSCLHGGHGSPETAAARARGQRGAGGPSPAGRLPAPPGPAARAAPTQRGPEEVEKQGAVHLLALRQGVQERLQPPAPRGHPPGAKAARPSPAAMKMPTMVPLSLLSVSALGAGGGGAAPGAEGGGACRAGDHHGLWQADPEESRLRDVRQGLPRRLPPQPAQAVALGREALPVPRLPAALQAQGPHELPCALPRRRRAQALRLQPLRQELLPARPSQQPRAPGAFDRETLQM
ncbi:unnamed protein product [Lepidochelys kempii]